MSLLGNALDNVLIGNGGNNRLNGGFGRDRLVGNDGNDVFVYRSSAEIHYDIITDFVIEQDKIDLSAFMSGGEFIGRAAFSGTENEVRYDRRKKQLQGDVDGDGEKDWQIRIANRAELDDADFLF